jgi:hypothetical protein
VRDVTALTTCIADRAAADASSAVVALAWLGSWLHHVGYLADRAEVRSREAAAAASQRWWAESSP